MWFITEINICGFPRYACGHTYILLTGGPENKILLAHLGIEKQEPILAIKTYAYYYLGTNQLRTSIRVIENDPARIKQQFQNIYRSNCRMWMVEDEERGARIYQTLIEQSNNRNLGPFLLYGKNYAHFFGGGSNCKDWSKSLLSMAAATGSGVYLELEDLLRELANRVPIQPVLESKASKVFP